ncbi:putative feruloyl esterase A [Cucumis melo var. makuwa]|uniref:Feruloyl esterase A n=1 Tax=Cucumis melo var. makuwa TaxID=1194695 RepID=A0A5A7UK90_CUCMM|nr:putative feruloyl esterase A [Cucumis melo var. makuwa]
MYNFGSPRVGNRQFAEIYNKKVKDSWRVVNHRDIIPTVPRLMGYCHVAQPVYLAAGDLKDALENVELQADGYEGDVIGESTPDVLVNEFMKGERELVEKLLQTEINIFRSIRDGSALMQHMEDFYYITLLEVNLYLSLAFDLECEVELPKCWQLTIRPRGLSCEFGYDESLQTMHLRFYSTVIVCGVIPFQFSRL